MKITTKRNIVDGLLILLVLTAGAVAIVYLFAAIPRDTGRAAYHRVPSVCERAKAECQSDFHLFGTTVDHCKRYEVLCRTNDK